MTDLGVQPQSATTPKSDQSLSDLNVDPQLKPWASPAGADRILQRPLEGHLYAGN